MRIVYFLFGVLALQLLASPLSKTSVIKTSEETPPAGFSEEERLQRVRGYELWQSRCSKCHALKNPTDYRNSEWELLMLHMRTVANINGQEQRLILDFLKSVNEDPQP